MKTDLQKLFQLKHYFSIISSSDKDVLFHYKRPSLLLMKNIHRNWLQYIYAKTYRQMPVYLTPLKKQQDISVHGVIKQDVPEYNEDTMLKHDFNTSTSTELRFDMTVPKQDAMQYFIKWQRYRKYWWSSISTTPSLFSVNDIKYEDGTGTADIVANFTSGQQSVENVTMNFDANETSSHLVCEMSLKGALIVMLMDGLTNKMNEDYLRLHRKITPYKISFALDSQDSAEKDTLKELATLLHHKLVLKKISSWLPDFSLDYNDQLQENLNMGVTCTAVLSNTALQNGIFKLVNSSSMLGEQLHVADFDQYAEILFK